MGRIVVTYIIPFFLPIAVYAGWVWYRARYVAGHGGEAPSFEKGPWPLLLFAGAVLALGVLGLSAVLSGDSPDGAVYVPPHMENGEIVPGHLEPKK